jgi:hypothetical protein
MTTMGVICKDCFTKYKGEFFDDIRTEYTSTCDLCNKEFVRIIEMSDVKNIKDVMNNYKTEKRNKEIDSLIKE